MKIAKISKNNIVNALLQDNEYTNGDDVKMLFDELETMIFQTLQTAVTNESSVQIELIDGVTIKGEMKNDKIVASAEISDSYNEQLNKR